jgi:hypothetical protein
MYLPEPIPQTAPIFDFTMSHSNSNSLPSDLAPPYQEFEEGEHIPLPLPFSTPGPTHLPLGQKSTVPSIHNIDNLANVGWPDLFSIPDSLIYPASSSPDPLAPPSPISVPASFSLDSLETLTPGSPPFPYTEYADDEYDSFPDPKVLTFPHSDLTHSNVISKPTQFSTPGPSYRPIYFSSPTSDPSSDAVELDPGYKMDLDYETLDFKFKPFIRTGVDSGPGSWMRQTHAQAEIDYGWNDEENENVEYDEEASQFYEEEILEDENQDKPLTSPLTNHNTANSYSYNDEPFFTPSEPVQKQVAALSPKLNVGPVFAPAPGIFISPLRNGHGPLSPDAIQSPKATVRVSLHHILSSLCIQLNLFQVPGPVTPENKYPHHQPTAVVRSRSLLRKSLSQHTVVLDESENSMASQVSSDSIESWTEPVS